MIRETGLIALLRDSPLNLGHDSKPYLSCNRSPKHRHLNLGSALTTINLLDPSFMPNHRAFDYSNLVSFRHCPRSLYHAMFLCGKGVDKGNFRTIEGNEGFVVAEDLRECAYSSQCVVQLNYILRNCNNITREQASSEEFVFTSELPLMLIRRREAFLQDWAIT